MGLRSRRLSLKQIALAPLLIFGLASQILIYHPTPTNAASAIVINEFSSQGATDWVELYNSTAAPIDVTNWSLKSGEIKVKDLTGEVAPHDFVVAELGPMLDGVGGVITLVNAQGVIVDGVSYGDEGNVAAPTAAMTAARTYDGGAEWATGESTKGAPNVPDTTPPTVPQIISPEDGRVSKNDTVTVTWSQATDLSDIKNYELRYKTNNQEPVTVLVSGVQTSYDMAISEEGVTTFAIRAIDFADNASSYSESVRYIYDATAPTLSLTSPSEGYVVSGGSVAVKGVVADSAALVLCQYQLLNANGSDENIVPAESCNSFAEGKIVFDVDVADRPSGTYMIKVTVKDEAGNVANDSVNIVIDHAAPALTISGPGSMRMDGTATLVIAADKPVSTLSVFINGEELLSGVERTPGENKWTVTYTPPSTGTYTIRATAGALYGGDDVQSSTTYSLVVLPNPPSVIQARNATEQLQQVAGALTQPLTTVAAPVSITPAASKDTVDAAAIELGDAASAQPVNEDAPVIAPSESGWKLFGIAWYWWLIIATAIAGVAGWLNVLRRRNQTA